LCYKWLLSTSPAGRQMQVLRSAILRPVARNEVADGARS
jgi:hypothetical protein